MLQNKAFAQEFIVPKQCSDRNCHQDGQETICPTLTLKQEEVSPETPLCNCSGPSRYAILHASETGGLESLMQQLLTLRQSVNCANQIGWNPSLHAEAPSSAAPWRDYMT